MVKRKKNFIYSLISVAAIIALWWLLSETTFKETGVIPSPLKTLGIIGEEMKKDSFFKAILNTLQRSLISFIISFAVASAAAVLSYKMPVTRKLLNPFISVCRSMPTAALILILLLTVGSSLLPIVVAFLIVFPLCYENMFASLSEVDKKLLTMAKVFRVPLHRQIGGIYLPAMLPYIFSSVIAGFGLNIKVVISAEVMGLPSMSIGYLMLSAKQGYDFGVTFAWLVVAVALSFVCEFILSIAGRLCMPFKYPDFNILRKATGKIFRNKKTASDD